jgi:chromosome partitioning protein
MKIIAFGTLKGGTGKTSTLFNIAGLLAQQHKVLMVDADPQFNLTTDAGFSMENMEKMGLQTLRDIFENGATARQVIYEKPIKALPNLDIILSSIKLTATEINIVSLAGREQLFNNFVLDNSDVLQEYDYILVDTNPNLGMINQNMFYAADDIVLISDISFNSIQGAEFFIALWETIRKPLRKPDNVAALILNNCDMRMNLPKDLIAYIKETASLRELLLQSVLPASIQVKNTELDHTPINLLVGKDTASREAIERVKAAYMAVLSELREKGIL